jgi:hypothetical protein
MTELRAGPSLKPLAALPAAVVMMHWLAAPPVCEGVREALRVELAEAAGEAVALPVGDGVPVGELEAEAPGAGLGVGRLQAAAEAAPGALVVRPALQAVQALRPAASA